MAMCQHLMAEPSAYGRKRGRLRLVCKAWKEECDKLTSKLALAPRMADTNLVQLVQWLPHLTSSELSRCSLVTAAGLHHLAPLADRLEELVLPTEGDFKLHEANVLREVYALSNLSSLDLGGLSISYQVLGDCGIGLPSLVHLRSAAKKLITDQLPPPWQALSGLTSLRLPHAELFWLGIVVRELRVLSTLQLLEVQKANFTEYGALRALSELSSLTELIVPASLDARQLLEMEEHYTQLRVLSFRNYNFESGKSGRSSICRLQRALPNARVTVRLSWEAHATVAIHTLVVVSAVLALAIIQLVVETMVATDILDGFEALLAVYAFLVCWSLVYDIICDLINCAVT